MKQLTHPNLETTDKIRNQYDDMINQNKDIFGTYEDKKKMVNVMKNYQDKVVKDTFPDSKRERQIAREMFFGGVHPATAAKMDEYNHLEKQDRELGLDKNQNKNRLSLESKFIDPVLAKKQEQNDTADDIKYLKKLALNPDKDLSGLSKEKFEHLFNTLISFKSNKMLQDAGIGPNSIDNLIDRLDQEELERKEAMKDYDL